MPALSCHPVNPAYRRRRGKLAAVFAGALTITAACGPESAPTEPSFAKGGQSASLMVTPSSLSFVGTSGAPQPIVARVQFVGLITASTSDPTCATVAPASVPATKPPGSSVYVAPFTVTPVGAGTCVITVTDKKGARATVQVRVTPAIAGRIVFASDRDGSGGEIYVLDSNGSQTRLTNNHVRDSIPAFSPDGALIAFESDRDGNAEIYVMKANGDNQTRLTNNPALDRWPAFSADGSMVAFTSNLDLNLNTEIFVVNADGTGLPTRLTNNPAFDGFPAFSPDGTKLIFESDRDDPLDFEIYVINADGTGLPTRLTDDLGISFTPAYSPDGSRITFASTRDGNAEIYVMDANGQNQIRLTNNPAQDRWPAFSPDGTQIAFESTRDGNAEIYIMNAADGTALANLTLNPAEDGTPDWR